MAKGANAGSAGGFFRAILLIALVGLAAYNTYEISQLKSEIATLREGHGVVKYPPTSAADNAIDTDSAALLKQAQGHLADAERFLHLKRYENARDELASATKTFQRANADTRAEGEKILAQLHGATNALSQHDDSPTPTDTPSSQGKKQ